MAFKEPQFLKRLIQCIGLSSLTLMVFWYQPACADTTQQSNQNIAYDLNNPLSDLGLTEIQWNHNGGLGQTSNQTGSSQSMLIAPKIKFDVSADWKTISRVYVNASKLQNVNGVNNAGIGPTQIETIFAPKSNSQTLVGIGPYLQIPGGQSGEFGSAQWGGGIRAVFVSQPKPWTFGLFAFQSWSLGGPTGAGTVASPNTGTTNSISVWPTIAYVTDNAYILFLDSESTYNYDARRGYSPINAAVGKVTQFGTTTVNFILGIRYNVGGYPSTLQYPGTPQGWGPRAQLIFTM
jgi:hypothetical protein